MLAMVDVGLHTMQWVESGCKGPPGAFLLLPSIVVGVCVDSCCVVEKEEVLHSVISATHQLFSKDEGVEF
jgi:hypothetical protein